MREAPKSSLVVQTVESLPEVRKTQVQSLGREDPLKKEMETHSSILTWKISWMEESMGSQRVGHNWTTSFHANVWVLSFTIMVAMKNSSLGLVGQKGLDAPWKAQFLENSLFGKTWTLIWPRAYSLQISCLFPRAFVKNNWQLSFNITWPEVVKNSGCR